MKVNNYKRNRQRQDLSDRVREGGRQIMLLEMRFGITVEDKRKYRNVEWWEHSDSLECPFDRVVFHFSSLKKYIKSQGKTI